MNIKNRFFIFTSLILTSTLFASNRVLAIGEFSMGLNLGITHDPNNMEEEITQYNIWMEAYREENSGASASQMSVPYSAVWGFNFKYQFNYLLFRLGCHLAKPGSPIKGNITPAGGVKNKIRITSYQNSYPVSIGFIIPLKERTYFYIGLGPTYHHTYVKITQSNPVSGLGSSNIRNRYTEDFAGYHLILGAEVPLTKRFTISTEWIHQEGTSYPMTNGGLDGNGNVIYTPKKTINVEGDFILLGVNYYIKI